MPKIAENVFDKKEVMDSINGTNIDQMLSFAVRDPLSNQPVDEKDPWPLIHAALNKTITKGIVCVTRTMN